jgi:hypothetical protein
MVSKNLPDAGQPWESFKSSKTAADFASHKSSSDNHYADADIIRLSVFIRCNPHPVVVCNPEGEVIKTNSPADRLLRRLNIDCSDLLPMEHTQIVQSCLEGPCKEYTTRVKVKEYTIALSYHAIPSFGIVYLYAIEITNSRKARAELLEIASNTLSLAESAIAQLQQLGTFLVNHTLPLWHSLFLTTVGPLSTSELFVAMDGCVFSERREH